MTRKNKKHFKVKSGGKWSKSVADYIQEQGMLVANQDLSPKHPKIKNPHLFK